MPTTKQISDYMVEPALVGVGLGAGAAYLFGTKAVVEVMGKDVRMWMFVAGLGVVSTIAMNFLDTTINAHLPENVSILTHPVETAVNIAGTAGILLAAESILSPGVASEAGMPIIAIAAGSKLGARYISHEYIMPWINKGVGDY